MNGRKIPEIAFGTYMAADRDIIIRSIEAGYRYFDTASLYESERALGEAIRRV